MNNYHREIKTSGDFDNDPNAALDALSKTGFAIFMISKNWFEDQRAIKEWRFAKDMNKPMVYIFKREKNFCVENKFLFDAPSLIGTIYDNGDTEEIGVYLQAFVAAFERNLDKEKNKVKNK